MSTAAVAGTTRRPSRFRGPAVNRWALLILPAASFLVVFFLAPLVLMGVRSVTDPPDAGLSNYSRFFDEEAYLRVLPTRSGSPSSRRSPASSSATRSPTS